MYKDLAELTYKKIFNGNLNFLSELAYIKNLIIKDQKLLSNNLQKHLFVNAIADKIKDEKLRSMEDQQRKYGKVIMNDSDKITALYNWLKNGIEEDEQNSNNKKIWIVDDSLLKKLSEHLKKEKLIEIPDVFYKLFLNTEKSSKVNWLKSNTLLIYLVSLLKKNHFIDDSLNENSFIERNFLNKGMEIRNIKQSKTNLRVTKNSLPKNHTLIDSFLNEYDITLPQKQTR